MASSLPCSGVEIGACAMLSAAPTRSASPPEGEADFSQRRASRTGRGVFEAASEVGAATAFNLGPALGYAAALGALLLLSTQPARSHSNASDRCAPACADLE